MPTRGKARWQHTAILPQANIAIISVKNKPQANKIRQKPSNLTQPISWRLDDNHRG